MKNPFTPVFGGKPDVFFGRKDILEHFDRALENEGSEYRALFVTGSRGYGKTVLLEQFSRRATEKGWTSIDVGPRNPIGAIMRHFGALDETTKTIDPEIEVSVFGTGGKLHGGSLSTTTRYDKDDFEYVLVDFCSKNKTGIFISIDEVQKVSLEDMSTISNAFQMASRKGHNVALAVAGLPQSYEKVIHQAGCTFMRRAAHIVLGPLTKMEVRTAFADVFRNMRGVSLQEPALEELVAFSKGHPYIMQLEGFYLVEHLNDTGFSSGKVDVDDVYAVLPTVLDSYFDRALQPLFDEIPRIEREYLVAMADVADEKGVAQTSDIAQELGKTQGQTSQARSYLLSDNLVYAPARGLLAFAIPYLGNYLKKGFPREHNGLSVIEEWL